jgi:hypothetical protein
MKLDLFDCLMNETKSVWLPHEWNEICLIASGMKRDLFDWLMNEMRSVWLPREWNLICLIASRMKQDLFDYLMSYYSVHQVSVWLPHELLQCTSGICLITSWVTTVYIRYLFDYSLFKYKISIKKLRLEFWWIRYDNNLIYTYQLLSKLSLRVGDIRGSLLNSIWYIWQNNYWLLVSVCYNVTVDLYSLYRFKKI